MPSCRGVLSISQEAQIDVFGMSDCKPVATPAEPNSKLLKAVAPPTESNVLQYPYRSAVGSLLWLARTSRPDILYSVSQVASHCHMWNSTHITAVKRIFRYLTLPLTQTVVLSSERSQTLIMLVNLKGMITL